MKNLFVLSAFAAILALSGCQSKKSESSSLELFPATVEGEGKVAAEFDGVKITDKYLSSFINELPPHVKARYNTPEKRERLILRVLEGEMLARAALKKGMTNDPALLIKIKAVIAQHYTKKGLRAEAEKKIQISEEEMKEFYETNKAKYDRPAKRRASHILVKVSEEAPKAEQDKALAKAKKILEEVKKEAGDPRSFASLAKKYSDDQGSKKRGGDVGYFSKTEEGGPMVKEFADAAFALAKKGDVSNVVRSKFGYHIIKLTGKRDAVKRTYDDVKPGIESILKAKKRRDAYESTIEEIKKSLNFQVNKETIAALDFSVPKNFKKQQRPRFPRQRRLR